MDVAINFGFVRWIRILPSLSRGFWGERGNLFFPAA